MRFSLSFMAVLLIIVTANDVQAAEMKLWPNQRMAHQRNINDNAAAYQDRARDYVNHTYATGGEEPMPEPEGFITAREYNYPSAATAGHPTTNDIKARKVNIDEVANIIRGNGDAEPPAPPVAEGTNTGSSVLMKRSAPNN